MKQPPSAARRWSAPGLRAAAIGLPLGKFHRGALQALSPRSSSWAACRQVPLSGLIRRFNGPSRKLPPFPIELPQPPETGDFVCALGRGASRSQDILRHTRRRAHCPLQGDDMDTANQAARLTVRPLAGGDSEWASSLVAAHFGSVKVVSRGVLHDTHRLPGLVAEQAGVPVGILHYRVDGRSCEIVTLVAAVLRRGIGGALLRAIVEVAHRKGCNRTWLVTTNDNTPAQAFYRAIGWRKVTVHRGATAEARRLKPEIPKTGWAGIPIEDEVEFEFRLAQ
jgi:ribosomal protein S18 acetylase RimI-like enzyme